jgi:hypothetical protein
MKFIHFLYEPLKTKFCTKFVQTYEVYYITNLTCDKLIMKIVWSLFIQRLVQFKHEHHALKHIWQADKCVDESSTNLWKNECHMNFTSYKYVCQMCFQCMMSVCETYKL